LEGLGPCVAAGARQLRLAVPARPISLGERGPAGSQGQDSSVPTGAQGGSVARALLEDGTFEVHVMMQSPMKEAKS